MDRTLVLAIAPPVLSTILLAQPDGSGNTPQANTNYEVKTSVGTVASLRLLLLP